MKVAYLSSDFGVPILGTKGCSIHVREIVRALRALGHEVRIYSPAPGDEAGAESAGIHAVPMNSFARRAARLLDAEDVDAPPHLFRELRRLLYAEQLRSTLRAPLSEYRPDILYERHSLLSYAGVEIAREFGIPHLLEVNAPLAREGANRRGWVLKHSAAEMEREILCSADRVLVVSEEVGEHARSLGVEPHRIAVIPNGVDTERFRPTVSGEEVRRRHGLDGIVVGYVGSLRPWHDLDTVLDAIDRVRATGTAVRFFPVGPGGERFASRTNGSVVWPGSVEHEQVPEYIAAMDVVLVPFGAAAEERYFSPLKLFEFMAMGKPIVAARMGQITELLTHGENGLLYESGDAADLASGIVDVVSRADRGAALGARARESAGAHTWRARAERLTDLANSLVGRGDR